MNQAGRLLEHTNVSGQVRFSLKHQCSFEKKKKKSEKAKDLQYVQNSIIRRLCYCAVKFNVRLRYDPALKDKPLKLIRKRLNIQYAIRTNNAANYPKQ